MRFCPSCGSPVEGEARYCLRCNAGLAVETVPRAAPPTWSRTSGSARYRVDLGDGPPIVLIEGDHLLLGRSSPSERVAGTLSSHGDVSRHHAMLQVQDQTVTVTDVGSAHGTFVDAERLTPDRPFVLKLPATVRLASDCRVFIDVEA